MTAIRLKFCRQRFSYILITADHVKVVARLRRRARVDGLHQLLEDHQGRQAADAAAVKREQAQVAAGHGVGASDGRRRRRRSTDVELSWDEAWYLFYMLAVASSWHCGAASPPPTRAAVMAHACWPAAVAAAGIHAWLVEESGSRCCAPDPPTNV
jgi:hypothetical protein